MLTKIVLWVSAIAFTSYGIACLLSPELPANYAGLAIIRGDGYAELGAMYGGLQTGFGLFMFLAIFNADLQRPALLLLVMTIGLLGIARLYSTVNADGELGFYTWGAATYELLTATLAALALRMTKTH